MRLEVSGSAYDDTADALVSGNQIAAMAYNELTGKLGGFGAMAGDDTTSEEFAREYDASAKEAVDGLNDAVDAFANLAELTAASIDNHRRANAESVYGEPAPYDGTQPLSDEPVDVHPFTPPTSLGGDDEDLPDFWNEIQDHLEGFAWPNADTGKLRQAAEAWRDAATDVEGLKGFCDSAKFMIENQESPEVPVAVAAIGDLKTACGELATELRNLGDACDEYATQVEEHRDVIRGIIRDMAIEAGVSIVAGAIVGFFSFGAGAAGGAAIAGWRIASAAKKILTALRALKAAAKARAVAKLASAASKVRSVRTTLRKFKNARKLKNAINKKKPPRKPGKKLPDRKRPDAAGNDYEGRVSDNGRGEVWQKPGAKGNANSVRVMDPKPGYPNGYVRYYNDQGQPIGLDGKPNIPGGTKAQNAAHTHIPMNPDGTYPTPKGWKP
jgi:hypothetical protein